MQILAAPVPCLRISSLGFGPIGIVLFFTLQGVRMTSVVTAKPLAERQVIRAMLGLLADTRRNGGLGTQGMSVLISGIGFIVNTNVVDEFTALLVQHRIAIVEGIENLESLTWLSGMAYTPEQADCIMQIARSPMALRQIAERVKKNG